MYNRYKRGVASVTFKHIRKGSDFNQNFWFSKSSDNPLVL